MGNAGSSSGRPHHDDTVDYGHLTPQGVYTGPRDWNHSIVTQLIVDRKLAPLYRPLEDYDDDWDDDQILAARKELPDPDPTPSDSSTARPDLRDPQKLTPAPKRASALKEPSRCPEAALYRGAAECPICFLYYPPNINHSRCCDQAICTECFVQIKRAEPTTTHLVSEPAACPYCVQDNFGIVYTPPPWRAGIGSEGMVSPHQSSLFLFDLSLRCLPPGPIPSAHTKASLALQPPTSAVERALVMIVQKSSQLVGRTLHLFFFIHLTSPLDQDHIRPDWEAKLNAVRAAATRRANRRIIMRQVGDRLIPVGVTSGRVHTLSTAEGGEAQDGEGGSPGSAPGSRRRRGARVNGQADLTQLLGQMGLGGQDLEEVNSCPFLLPPTFTFHQLMVMEAMRLSLIEHEARQRREEQRRQEVEHATAGQPSSTPNNESASFGIQSGATALLLAPPPSQALQADNSSGGTNSARSRSSTPVSGQTTSSSPHGTAVDDQNDISNSIERSLGESSRVTETLTLIGNGEAHTAHTSSNGERSRSPCSTSIRGQGQQSENPAGTITTSCTPHPSSFDTDTSHP
ncbi:hypothetical protein JVU11DRAFT_616 [Chiua virens]|nr:hypothetical protein JVU11DRAFT_616 [Chiua virens]